MGSGSESGSKLFQAVAGLESGVLGGVFMLAWLALGSALEGRSVWRVSNLMASTFYGDAALRRGFRWTTLSGVALHVIMTATLGLLFGLAVSEVASRSRVRLLGLGTGMAWYFVTLGVFWRHVNPVVELDSRGAGMFLAHLGLGLFLASFPWFLGELEAGDAEEKALESVT
jgi:hypothetical protein